MSSPTSLASSAPELVTGHQTPRIGTPRTLELPTRGPQLAAVAELRGFTYEPWQNHVADVALEFNPETGLWVHSEVDLLVARQNGKTELLADRVLASLYVFDFEKLVLHTAQDRTVPEELFEKLVEIIGDTPALHRRLHARKGINHTNGKQQIRLKDGSRYKVLAPRADAFRGYSCHLLIMDEARTQRDWNLWNAATPTQSALGDAKQRWVVSNAGDARSVVLDAIQASGRKAAADPASYRHKAYLEWSAAEDRPLDDEEGWREANPGYGLRITRATVRAELAVALEDPEALAGFIAERLCRRAHGAKNAAIPLDAWNLCAMAEPPLVEPGPPRPVLGIDVDGDRTHGAIALAAWREGRLVVDVVEEFHADPAADEAVTSTELTEAALRWMTEYRISRFAGDPMTIATVATNLEAKKKKWIKLTASARMAAAGSLYDQTLSGALAHRGNLSLTSQIQRAARKVAGDDLWYISRQESEGTISGVIATAGAVYGAQLPTRTPKVQ